MTTNQFLQCNQNKPIPTIYTDDELKEQYIFAELKHLPLQFALLVNKSCSQNVPVAAQYWLQSTNIFTHLTHLSTSCLDLLPIPIYSTNLFIY